MNLILLLIIILNTVLNIQAKMFLQNDFAKLVQYDDAFVKVNNFKFYKKDRNHAALNISYDLLVDITSDEDLRVNIAALEFRGNEYKKTVIDFSVGLCTLYKANKFDTLSLIKQSNLKKGCPFFKGSYYINDLAPTASILPPFFPEGKWLVDLRFFRHGNVVTHVQWMLTLAKKP